uniref:(California timema) hypothetical protein n=1 Tax=Timema californicum TaxID=61474 RepID=A0A7R9IWW8_TIMCA|nr:unnamed protein product [Timema californicum]
MKGVVHENPRIGLDGESEEASFTSDEVTSPVKLRPKNRKLSEQDINKRLSLPADLHLPESFVAKQNVSPTVEGPLSRSTRRQSLSEIGFGRMETYTKLHKLGQILKNLKHKALCALPAAIGQLVELFFHVRLMTWSMLQYVLDAWLPPPLSPSGSSSISSSTSLSLDSCCSLIISAASRVPQTVMSSSAAMYFSYVQSGANLCQVSSSHGRGPICGSEEGPGWELASIGGGSFGSLALAAVGSTWTAASSSTDKTNWACRKQL